MSKIWPEGTENAIEVSSRNGVPQSLMLTNLQVLNRFLYYPARKQDLGLVDPRTQGGDHPSSRTEQEDSDSEVEILEESPVKTPAKKGGAKAKGSATNDGTASQTRIRDYTSSRNSAAANTSSRLSPYLASGVISIRVVLNKVKKLLGNKLESGRDSGPGTWVMECAWRDFYNHVRPHSSLGSDI
jgi:deoxyribodipyrimidine photolyase